MAWSCGMRVWDFVTLGREMKGQPSGSLCRVILPYHRCHLSWVQHSPLCGISLWGSNSPTLYTPSHPTLQSFLLLRSQLHWPECRDLGRLG